jgi:hypothetical protein
MEWQVLGGLEQYEWVEFVDDGSELLTEDGVIWQLGGRVGVHYPGGPSIRGRGELFFGDVDYDGETQDGIPVTTDTTYAGALVEADVLLPLMRRDAGSVGVYGGGGCRLWRRSLGDSYDPVAYGYDEDWSVYYLLAGLRGELKLQEAVLSGEARLRMPFETEADYGSFAEGGGSLSVSPGKELAWELEGGVRWRRFQLELFYRAWEFSKSNVVEVFRGIFVWQPESESTMVGIRGILFL